MLKSDKKGDLIQQKTAIGEYIDDWMVIPIGRSHGKEVQVLSASVGHVHNEGSKL